MTRPDILEDLAEVQGLAGIQPAQEHLDVEPRWLREDRRHQRDRERKQNERDTLAIVEELRRSVVVEPCACGCGGRARGRGKYASDECRTKARQERDRVRKAEQRAAALAAIREAEGIVERVCARDGCGVVFPVELNATGRPQEYCSVKCRVLAAVRSWRARRKR